MHPLSPAATGRAFQVEEVEGIAHRIQPALDAGLEFAEGYAGLMQIGVVNVITMRKLILFCLVLLLAALFYSGADVAAAGQITSFAGEHPAVKETPLILNVNDGERRIRRVMGGALAVIKVDQRNGGSPQLVMGYEEIPVGEGIQPHHHPKMDEIIFVHSGSGLACLGGQSAEVHAGGTLFIPRGTRVMLRNTGDVPVAIAYFFSAPGYEEYLRDTSVPEGREVLPLTATQLSEIRDRQRDHIVFDEVPETYCSPVLP